MLGLLLLFYHALLLLAQLLLLLLRQLRLMKLQVNSRMAGQWTTLNPQRTYRVVTNSYIAGGKDGYKTFGTVSKRGDAEDTYLDYAQSFVDYVKQVGTIDKLPMGEYSTQSFTNKDGKLQ